MRAVMLALLVACAPRVIDLGRATPDAHVDSMPDAPALCACRVPCVQGSQCPTSAGQCATDGYCTQSVGACTATTPTPCNQQFQTSVCRASPTSTSVCP